MKLVSHISRIFEPMIVMSIIALLGGWRAGLRGGAYVGYATILICLSLFIAFVRLRMVKKLKTNWDISERHKRIHLLFLLLGFVMVLFGSITFWHNSELTKLYGFFLLWLVGFLLITLKIKASGHVGVVTLLIGLCALWFGSRFFSMVVFIPLVGWSRYRLRRHAIDEVVIGFVYSVILVYVALSLRLIT